MGSLGSIPTSPDWGIPLHAAPPLRVPVPQTTLAVRGGLQPRLGHGASRAQLDSQATFEFRGNLVIIPMSVVKQGVVMHPACIQSKSDL